MGDETRVFNGVDANARWTPLLAPPRLNGQVLNRMLPMLVGLNVDYIRENPGTPSLYRSGIHYVRDRRGAEQWLTIPWVMARRSGDCKSLAAWRAAELRVKAREDARCVWIARRTPQGMLYHVCVARANGRWEDPSLVLGMGWNEPHRVVKIF